MLGIVPDWSDSANEGGGRYIVRCPKECVDAMWVEMMMAMVGHKFCPERDGCINGCVVSVRSKADRVAVWVKHGSDEQLVGQAVENLFGKRGDFKVHCG